MTVAQAREAGLPYRMKELSDLTGLPRQVIHFYIQQGLVPEGKKTGRNMAYYGEEHLERIKLIRQLQHERFLPLKAIKAMLEERDDAFTPEQRRLLLDVKQRLALRTDKVETVDARELLLRYGMDRKDLEEMARIGVLAVSEGPKGKLLISKDDAWMLELWGGMRAAGFTRELGFDTSLLLILEDAISTMFKRETEVLTARLSTLPADQVAAMVEAALPMIHTFLVRYHETKVRNFFATM